MIKSPSNGWFPLFGEDYQKFKHLLNVGDAIYLEGKFQKRWNSEELQLKLSELGG